MSAVLEILLQAKDQTAGVFSAVEQSAGGLGNVMSGALTFGLGAATAGFAALGGGLALAVSEAMDAQGIMAQTESAIKATGGAAGMTAEEINTLAGSLSKTSRFSDDAIQKGENLLLTFTNIGKDVFPMATQSLVDMAQAMGTDVSGGAIQLGKALNDPIKGVGALSKVGVTFTEEQKEVIKKMVETGDVAGAQKIILGELSREFGGSAAAAAGTLAGRMDVLKNSLLNMAEGIGTSALPLLEGFVNNVIMPAVPVVEEIAGQFSYFFQMLAEGDTGGALDALYESFDVLSNALPGFSDGIHVVKEAFGELAGMVQRGISTWRDTEDIVETVGAALTNVVPPATVQAVQDLLAAFLQSMPMIKATVDEAFTFVKGLIAQVMPGITANVTDALSTLAAFWKEHGAEVMAVISFAFKFIATVIAGTLQVVGGIISAAVTVITGLWSAASDLLKGNWQGAWDTIKVTLATAGQAILGSLTGMLNTALSLVGTNLESFKTTWSNVFDQLKVIVKTALDAAKTAITNAIEGFKAVGGDIMRGLADGIGGAAGFVMDAAKNAISGAISAAKNLLGIHSPSRVFMDIGLNTMEGMAQGINVGAGQAAQASQKATQQVVASSRQTVNNYNLSVSSAQSSLGVATDFSLMRARAF